MTTKISLLTYPSVVSCNTHAAAWAASQLPHYSSLMCMKSNGTVTSGPIQKAYEQISQFITDPCTEQLQTYCCVLPKNHTGGCDYNPAKAMFSNDTVSCKFDWLFSTPGDDDYIYKNRATRLFPFKVPDDLQRIWRNKEVKRKCAIPLKEGSTPEMMAAAWLDYITLMLSVEGINEVIKEYKHIEVIREMIAIHKDEMIKHYAAIGKRIFDDSGFTICPVMGVRLKVAQIANPDLCDLNAIQLGHVVPRTDEQYTIRGKNILMMTRRGNLLVGDCSFIDDTWITQMEQAARFQRSNECVRNT